MKSWFVRHEIIRSAVHNDEESRGPRSSAAEKRAREKLGGRSTHNEECPCWECLREKVLSTLPQGATMNRKAQRKYYRKMRKDGVNRAEALDRLMIEARLHELDRLRKGRA